MGNVRCCRLMSPFFKSPNVAKSMNSQISMTSVLLSLAFSSLIIFSLIQRRQLSDVFTSGGETRVVMIMTQRGPLARRNRCTDFFLSQRGRNGSVRLVQ